MTNSVNTKKSMIIRVSLVLIICLIIGLFIVNSHPNKQNINDLKIKYVNYEYSMNEDETKSIILSNDYVEKIEKFLKTNNNGILENNTTENMKVNRELFIGSNKHGIRIKNNTNNKNKFIIEFYSESLIDNFTDSLSNNENSLKQMEINSSEMGKIFEELNLINKSIAMPDSIIVYNYGKKIIINKKDKKYNEIVNQDNEYNLNSLKF